MGFEDKLKAMGVGMDDIRGEIPRNFQTIMVALHNVAKEGNNKKQVVGCNGQPAARGRPCNFTISLLFMGRQQILCLIS